MIFRLLDLSIYFDVWEHTIFDKSYVQQTQILSFFIEHSNKEKFDKKKNVAQ